MKKWFICASVVVLAGAIYWLCKRGKSNTATSQMVDKKVDFETNSQEEENSQNTDVVEKMYQTKNESAQTVYERHTEASSIMKDAYSNIMEDFSTKSNTNSKDKNKEIVIDRKSVSVMKEIDSISDELEDLLK